MGISRFASGTRPVLKSSTETRPSSISSRSAVPAITRPSASVAASGASPSEPGPNSGAKRAIGEDAADLLGNLLPPRGVGDARGTLEPASARSRRSLGSTSASRSSSWWISVPRLAAARIAALGGGPALVLDDDCEGASGRGGRGSAGAGALRPIGNRRAARRAILRRLRALGDADRPAIARSAALQRSSGSGPHQATPAPARPACASCSRATRPRFGSIPATTSRSLARVMAT